MAGFIFGAIIVTLLAGLISLLTVFRPWLNNSLAPLLDRWSAALDRSFDSIDRVLHKPIIVTTNPRKQFMDPDSHPVTIVDINMKFRSMVWFMVKWAFASIPALIIISVISFGIVVVGGMLLQALGAVFPTP
jgi:hypothetical protein